MGAFWHPFANMAQVDGHELVMVHGDGVYVTDRDGKRYLDGTAGLWYNTVGYGRQEIVDAAGAQLAALPTFHTFGDYATGPVLTLADRLASLAPLPGSKVFFTSGGSDAVDTAAKLARRYFALTGEAERVVFLTREWAYHGMHAYGTSLAGMAANLEGHGPMVEQVRKVPYDSVDALAAAIDDIGPERIAGFYAEPVIGAGGVRPAPDGYLKQARQLIRDAGGLFISDEVITAFGRVGDWFAATRFSLEPDLVTFAKGVTSGYLPLGGVLVAPRVAAPFWEGEGTLWRHGYTYSGHATVCAAALANLAIIEREELLSRALVLEVEMMEELSPLTDHPLVTELRGGVGVMAAVQIDPAVVEADPGLPNRAVLAARGAGVITRALGGGGLQVSPPLTITRGQLADLAAGIATGLDAVG
jgi:putrescine aminotransferase